MNQNNSYTRTNDKNRKHIFSNITKHNKNPKVYSSSQNRSVRIQSNITKTTFPHTPHQSQNNKSTKIQNNKIGQHKQNSSTKNIQKISIPTIPLPQSPILTANYTTPFPPIFTTQQNLIIRKYVQILWGKKFKEWKIHLKWN